MRILACLAFIVASGCVASAGAHDDILNPRYKTFTVVAKHETNGVLRDEGYTEFACHMRIAKIISMVAETGKLYSYNGTDSAWGHDSHGYFTIRCVPEA